ncbi:MAG: phasin family protein [Gammaproteobacteria bacterium]|nr:phasin family protein [Gammaproteobacteria bacterium]
MAKIQKSSAPSMFALAGDLFGQIRLAGLGVAATLQEKGSQLFFSLVEEGAAIEARVAGKPAPGKAQPVQRPVTGEDAAKLEEIFETRVSRTLQRLQVPTRQDLKKIMAQMDTLQKQVKTLVDKEPAKPTDG